MSIHMLTLIHAIVGTLGAALFLTSAQAQEPISDKPNVDVTGSDCKVQSCWWGQGCAMVRQTEVIGFNRYSRQDQDNRLVIIDAVVDFPRGPSAIVAALLLYDDKGAPHAPKGFTIPIFKIQTFDKVTDKNGTFRVPRAFRQEFVAMELEGDEFHPFENGALCFVNPKTSTASALSNPSSLPGQLYFDLKTVGLSKESTPWKGGEIRVLVFYEVPVAPKYRLEFIRNMVPIKRAQAQPAIAPAKPTSEGGGKLPVPTNILPPYEAELVGANEVRVSNPNDFAVVAGIRFQKTGKDFRIPANGVGSVNVPDGTFDIYFVYSDKPDALFKGDPFTLKANGLAIKLVNVAGGNYEIRRVK
jgi:hypothetical protein